MFEDKTLKCRECGAEFVFTASEQQFYADKGFQNEPGRCPACRAARRAQNGGAPRGERQMYDVICDALRSAHSGSVPAPRRSSGLLQSVPRSQSSRSLLIDVSALDRSRFKVECEAEDFIPGFVFYFV